MADELNGYRGFYVPAWIATLPAPVRAEHKLALALYLHHQGENESAFPSYETVGAELGRSKRVALDIARDLVRWGFLEQVTASRGRRSNHYRVVATAETAREIALAATRGTGPGFDRERWGRGHRSTVGTGSPFASHVNGGHGATDNGGDGVTANGGDGGSRKDHGKDQLKGSGRARVRADADASPSLQLDLVPPKKRAASKASTIAKPQAGIAALAALREAIKAGTGGKLVERKGDVTNYLAAIEALVDEHRGELSLEAALRASADDHVASIKGRCAPSPKRWDEDLRGWLALGSYRAPARPGPAKRGAAPMTPPADRSEFSNGVVNG